MNTRCKWHLIFSSVILFLYLTRGQIMCVFIPKEDFSWWDTLFFPTLHIDFLQKFRRWCEDRESKWNRKDIISSIDFVNRFCNLASYKYGGSGWVEQGWGYPQTQSQWRSRLLYYSVISGCRLKFMTKESRKKANFNFNA